MGESAWQVVEESTCSVSEDPTIGFRTDGLRVNKTWSVSRQS